MRPNVPKLSHVDRRAAPQVRRRCITQTIHKLKGRSALASARCWPHHSGLRLGVNLTTALSSWKLTSRPGGVVTIIAVTLPLDLSGCGIPLVLASSGTITTRIVPLVNGLAVTFQPSRGPISKCCGVCSESQTTPRFVTVVGAVA